MQATGGKRKRDGEAIVLQEDIVRTDHIEGHETKEMDRSDGDADDDDDVDCETVTPQAKRRRIQDVY